MRQQLKSALKRLLPGFMLGFYRRQLDRRLREEHQRLSIRETFSRIYEQGLWGKSEDGFCSGQGSTPEHADAYAQMIAAFVKTHDVRRIVDLGCGDFVLGQRIAPLVERYVGVDVVPALIARNQRLYANERIHFECIDITSDPLPEAELCLIRQVLQHLSNEEIGRVLGRLRAYRYVIVTEHYPGPSVRLTPNRDKPHGHDTRVLDDSAVVLDAPPFDCRTRLLLDVDAVGQLKTTGERIRSFLIEGFPGSDRA